MFTVSQPICWNQRDSACVEKRGPWMTTAVPPLSTGMPSSRAVSTMVCLHDGVGQVGAEVLGGRDQSRPRPLVERVRASTREVDKLVAHHERPELEVEAKRATDDGRDDAAHAKLLQRPDVGPVGDHLGGISSSAPRRGRNATFLPPSSASSTGADGLPYGVSSSMLSASSKGEEYPEMPMTPISASATGVS
jgi:hypothetical protein